MEKKAKRRSNRLGTEGQMTDPIHRKTFQVRAVDIDQSGHIQPIIFIEYLLESAAEHAGRYGLSVTDLFKKGLTWVLSRFHVEFFRYPEWGDTVEIRTWPSAQLPLFAVRDYEVSDGRGPMASATSSWLIVDLKHKRPVRTDGHLAGFPILARRAVADDFSPLPAPSREDGLREFPVFFSDLDINRHVTATAYVHLALESVPDEVLFGFRPAGIEVNFRAEAFYGDRILSRVEQLSTGAKPSFLHRLSRSGDDKELTLLRTSWLPFQPGPEGPAPGKL